MSNRPRLRLRPVYTRSQGPRLLSWYAEHTGVRLDVWQRNWVADTLAVRGDGQWAAFESGLVVGRQAGKGVPTEVLELGGLFLLGERLIIHSAHQLRTSREAFRRALDAVNASEVMTAKVRTVMRSRGEEGIELRDGARLLYVARSKVTMRGFTGARLVLDEALALDSDEMEALVPTLSAVPMAQIVYTSTVPKVSDSYLAGVRVRAMAGAPRLVWHEFGVDRDVNLGDRRVWARANPAYPARITAERMADLRRVLGDEGFAAECLSIWPEAAGGWQVIGKSAWSDAQDPFSEPLNPVAVAVDVMPDRSFAAIAVAGRRADGRVHVEVAGRDGLPDYLPGVPWVLPRLGALVASHRPCVTVVNDRSLAEAAAAAGLTVFRPSAPEVAAWCGTFYDAVAGPDVPSRRLKHLGQEVFNSAVQAAAKRTVGNAWSWYWNPVLTAASLAVGALETPRLHTLIRMPMATFMQGAAPPRRDRPLRFTTCVRGACPTPAVCRLTCQLENVLEGSTP